MKNHKIGIIGCGRIAHTYLEAYRLISNVDIVAVADINIEAAKIIAEEFKCKYFTDYRDLLKIDQVDSVIVSTPPNVHREIVLQALLMGKNVLCEKPFAMNAKEAKEMISASKKNNRFLMMASKFRFNADIVKAKRMIESGMLGEIVFFENAFCSQIDMRHRWNSIKGISGGGVLMDNGPHSADIVRFLVGPIKELKAQIGKQIQEIDVEDNCHIYFKTINNVMCSIDLSWSINKGKEEYISIYGTEGNIYIGWHSSKYLRNDKREEYIFGQGYNKIDCFKTQLLHFFRCIDKEEKPVITLKDALESVRVIEAAYKSIQINKCLKVGEKRDAY